MRVKDVRPIYSPPNAKGFRTIGRFNLEVAAGLLLYDLTLVRSPVGKLMLYGPTTNYGAPSSSMAPAVRAKIIDIAKTYFEDVNNNDFASAA